MFVKAAATLAAMIAVGIPLPDHLPPERSSLARESRTNQIVDLHEFASLRTEFERHKGDVRLVALLSPTCGYCIKGYRYMRKLLDEISDPRLKMFVVWESILSGDSRAVAARQAARGKDPRLAYQAWDGDNLTGKAWSGAMGVGSPAWDVYFLYGPGATWTADRPTAPAYWQHQGAGGRENWLNYDQLKAHITQLLERAE